MKFSREGLVSILENFGVNIFFFFEKSAVQNFNLKRLWRSTY